MSDVPPGRGTMWVATLNIQTLPEWKQRLLASTLIELGISVIGLQETGCGSFSALEKAGFGIFNAPRVGSDGSESRFGGVAIAFNKREYHGAFVESKQFGTNQVIVVEFARRDKPDHIWTCLSLYLPPDADRSEELQKEQLRLLLEWCEEKKPDLLFTDCNFSHPLWAGVYAHPSLSKAADVFIESEVFSKMQCANVMFCGVPTRYTDRLGAVAVAADASVDQLSACFQAMFEARESLASAENKEQIAERTAALHRIGKQQKSEIDKLRGVMKATVIDLVLASERMRILRLVCHHLSIADHELVAVLVAYDGGGSTGRRRAHYDVAASDVTQCNKFVSRVIGELRAHAVPTIEQVLSAVSQHTDELAQHQAYLGVPQLPKSLADANQAQLESWATVQRADDVLGKARRRLSAFLARVTLCGDDESAVDPAALPACIASSADELRVVNATLESLQRGFTAPLPGTDDELAAPALVATPASAFVADAIGVPHSDDAVSAAPCEDETHAVPAADEAASAATATSKASNLVTAVATFARVATSENTRSFISRLHGNARLVNVAATALAAVSERAASEPVNRQRILEEAALAFELLVTAAVTYLHVDQNFLRICGAAKHDEAERALRAARAAARAALSMAVHADNAADARLRAAGAEIAAFSAGAAAAAAGSDATAEEKRLAHEAAAKKALDCAAAPGATPEQRSDAEFEVQMALEALDLATAASKQAAKSSVTENMLANAAARQGLVRGQSLAILHLAVKYVTRGEWGPAVDICDLAHAAAAGHAAAVQLMRFRDEYPQARRRFVEQLAAHEKKVGYERRRQLTGAQLFNAAFLSSTRMVWPIGPDGKPLSLAAAVAAFYERLEDAQRGAATSATAAAAAASAGPLLLTEQSRDEGAAQPARFSIVQLRAAVKRYASKEGRDPDGVNGRLLNLLVDKDDVAQKVLNAFNAIVATSNVPVTFRRYFTVMAHKGGARTVDNYRPICVTSLFSRTFERLVRERAFEEIGHLFDPAHSAYLPGCSSGAAAAAVIRLLTEATRTSDNAKVSNQQGNRVALLLKLDIAKAFESVNVESAVEWLRKSGLNDKLCDVIAAWAKERHFKFKFDATVTPDWLKSPSGVPQGSVFGPLLWLAALQSAIEKARLKLQCETGTDVAFFTIIYADDIFVVFVPLSTVDQHAYLRAVAQLYLQRLVSALAYGGFTLSSKSCAMFVHATFSHSGENVVARKEDRDKVFAPLGDPGAPQVHFKNADGTLITSISVLGIMISDTLNTAEHAAALRVAVDARVEQLRKFHGSPNQMRVLCNSLTAQLNAFAAVYGPLLTAAGHNSLDVARNSIARIMTESVSTADAEATRFVAGVYDTLEASEIAAISLGHAAAVLKERGRIVGDILCRPFGIVVDIQRRTQQLEAPPLSREQLASAVSLFDETARCPVTVKVSASELESANRVSFYAQLLVNSTKVHAPLPEAVCDAPAAAPAAATTAIKDGSVSALLMFTPATAANADGQHAAAAPAAAEPTSQRASTTTAQPTAEQPAICRGGTTLGLPIDVSDLKELQLCMQSMYPSRDSREDVVADVAAAASSTHPVAVHASALPTARFPSPVVAAPPPVSATLAVAAAAAAAVMAAPVETRDSIYATLVERVRVAGMDPAKQETKIRACADRLFAEVSRRQREGRNPAEDESGSEDEDSSDDAFA